MAAPSTSPSPLSLPFRCVGLALCAVAILVNPWIVATLHPEEPLPPEALADTIRAELVLGGLGALMLLAGHWFSRRDLSRGGRRAVLFTVSLLLPPVVAECLLAPFVERSTSIFQRDEQLGWKLIPGASDFWVGTPVTINSLGVRGPERPHEKPAGVRRVLFLGDSVAFGFKIEDDAETLPGQLERDLREEFGGGLEVINGCCGGWSPWQQRIFLAQEGARYEPDLVILGFVLNDVTEKLDLVRFGGEGQSFQLNRSRGSGVWNLLRGTAIGHFLRLLRARLEFGPDAREGAIQKEQLSVYDLIQQPNRDDVQHAWRITQRSIDGILRWCRERDIPLLFVMFPYTVQLFAAERAEQNPPQWIMERFCEPRDLPMLDLRPYLVEVMAREGLSEADLFIDALHPTALGHRYISRALRDTIVREGLLPEQQDPPDND